MNNETFQVETKELF